MARRATRLPVTNALEKDEFIGFHWHPNATEIVTVISGQGQAVKVLPIGLASGMKNKSVKKMISEGCVIRFEQGSFHYIENTSEEVLRVNNAFETPGGVGITASCVTVVEAVDALSLLGKESQSLKLVYDDSLSYKSVNAILDPPEKPDTSPDPTPVSVS